MAMGKPVIASRVGGVPEIVEDGVSGSLVPPADIKALSCAILDLIANPAKRTALGQNAQRRFEELDFTAKRVLPEILAIYRLAAACPDGRSKSNKVAFENPDFSKDMLKASEEVV
jgi:glycosyltransferase involved in cell wall biosynthesis